MDAEYIRLQSKHIILLKETKEAPLQTGELECGTILMQRGLHLQIIITFEPTMIDTSSFATTPDWLSSNFNSKIASIIIMYQLLYLIESVDGAFGKRMMAIGRWP